MTSRRIALILALGLLTFRALPAHAASASELSSTARAALKKLYAANPSTKTLGNKATAILVFPKIMKAGFMVGAQSGDGAMLKGGKTVGYYRSLAASYADIELDREEGDGGEMCLLRNGRSQGR